MLSERNTKKEEKAFKVKYLIEAFGISPQAHYQRIKRYEKRQISNEKVIEMVLNYRKDLPHTGTRKLHFKLSAKFKAEGIKMGRDNLNDLLRSRGLFIKTSKRFHITTDSKHYFYTSPNLLKDIEITHSEQVFVSDITYIKTDNGHAYLALVTDAYSRKIMGWSLENNMKVEMVKPALEMAYKNCVFRHKTIIHHSDRGIQYCCPDYTQFADKKGFIMSTTQKYDPYENAIAERINGILKYEFGLKNSIKSVKLAQMMVREAVHLYNTERMHLSLDYQTPQEVHLQYNKHKNKNYKKIAC